MIPYSRQRIYPEDIKEVVKVLKSNYLTKGPKVIEFEKNLKLKLNAKYAITCNSGSTALFLACRSINIKKGDIVLTTPNTYAASANCVLECGAEIDFVDIDPLTWNISLEKLETKLIFYKKKRKKIKALILVHLAGFPNRLEKIFVLSKKYKFKIIEDASHAIGSSYKKHPIGSCKWSDLSTFSFHPVKNITSGEGGAVLTNNKKLAKKIKLVRENGINTDRRYFKQKSYYPYYYEQVDTGFNFRMSDICAALGNSQLKKIDFFINQRNKIAKKYIKLIKNKKFTFQKTLSDAKSSYHLFIVKLINDDIKEYKKIFKIFKKNNISINLHYKSLHLNPFFLKKGFKKGQFLISENYSRTAFSIPIFVGIRESIMNKIVKILNNF